MNNTTDASAITDDNILEPRTIAQTAVAVLFLIVTMLAALIGNIAVIAVIVMYRTMRRDISNLLIINLSITDLSMTLTVMLSALVSLTEDEWVFGSFWCDFICATNYCLIIVSMLTLCFISIDRYQAVIHSLHYQSRVTRKRVIIAIVYSWFQGVLFASIPSFMNWVEYDYWEAICAIQWFKHQARALYYVIAAFALCFLGPGIVLIYNYAKILKEAKKQKTQIQTYPSNQAKKKMHQAATSNRIVWSLLVVVFAYFICTTPFSVTKLIKVSAHKDHFVPGQINLIASLLGYVASAINPLIYGIFRRDFQKAYRGLLQTILPWRRGSKSTPSFSEDWLTSDYPRNTAVNLTDTSPEKPEINGHGQRNSIIEVNISTP